MIVSTRRFLAALSAVAVMGVASPLMAQTTPAEPTAPAVSGPEHAPDAAGDAAATGEKKATHHGHHHGGKHHGKKKAAEAEAPAAAQ